MKRNDPANYRRNSVPFETVEESNKALAAFFDDVRVARDKHRIADLIVIAEINVIIDGEETRGAATSFLGDSNRVLTSLAREYGAAQQRQQEDLALIIAAAKKAARRP